MSMAIVCGDGGTAKTPQPQAGIGGEIVSEMPADVDPDRRYLIYLHNMWMESRGPDLPHPRFGVYEYQEILQALAAPGLVVISEVRPPRSDPHQFARRVSNQITTLLGAGVPPQHVTVVGFSKGGAIAILASSELADDRVNFVFLAACGSWVESAPGVEARGRMLSIREASDDLVESCAGLFARAPSTATSQELVVHLGGGHGAFFRPHAEWVDPIIDWATTDD